MLNSFALDFLLGKKNFLRSFTVIAFGEQNIVPHPLVAFPSILFPEPILITDFQIQSKNDSIKFYYKGYPILHKSDNFFADSICHEAGDGSFTAIVQGYPVNDIGILRMLDV